MKIDANSYENFKQKNAKIFNENGKESKLHRRRNSITKIIWNFKEASEIIHNLLEKKRYFFNEEINLG